MVTLLDVVIALLLWMVWLLRQNWYLRCSPNTNTSTEHSLKIPSEWNYYLQGTGSHRYMRAYDFNTIFHWQNYTIPSSWPGFRAAGLFWESVLWYMFEETLRLIFRDESLPLTLLTMFRLVLEEVWAAVSLIGLLFHTFKSSPPSPSSSNVSKHEPRLLPLGKLCNI